MATDTEYLHNARRAIIHVFSLDTETSALVMDIRKEVDSLHPCTIVLGCKLTQRLSADDPIRTSAYHALQHLDTILCRHRLLLHNSHRLALLKEVLADVGSKGRDRSRFHQLPVEVQRALHHCVVDHREYTRSHSDTRTDQPVPPLQRELLVLNCFCFHFIDDLIKKLSSWWDWHVQIHCLDS